MFDSDDQSQKPQPLPENLTGEQALQMLVGEENRYKTVEDLALAALHAQQHILTLEDENAQFRQETQKGKTVQDILDAIQKRQSAATEDETPPADPAQSTPVTPDKVAEMVADVLKKQDATSRAEANRAKVETELKTLYGEKAAQVFRSVSTKMGVDLEALSATSPEAALTLVKTAVTPQQSPGNDPLPTGTRSSAPNRTGNTPSLETATLSQLKEMQAKGLIKRDIRMRYEIQNALRMGDDFFK